MSSGSFRLHSTRVSLIHSRKALTTSSILSRSLNFFLPDVLRDTYDALEALAKIICNNDRDLSANREKFVSGLKLADSYKRMLKEYIEYANDFARHAGPDGKQKPLPSRREVESFMY